MNLLYVCYANKGRSPAFEAYTRHFIKKYSLEGVKVNSAGIGLHRIEQMRREEHPLASKATRQILNYQGLSIDNHLITYVGDVISKSDLLLVSDQHTLDMVVEEFPDDSPKVMIAGEYARSRKYREVHGPHHSCRGPIKSEIEGYKKMLAEIRHVSKRVAKRLKQEGFEL